jgi:hypothetical protein
MTHIRPSKFIRDKKEKLVQVQAFERKKVIEQINKEFAPRFERLRKSRNLEDVKASSTGGLRDKFTPTAQKEKPPLKTPYQTAVKSHESQKESTANDNSKAEEKPRTRNRSKDRKPRRERTRSRGREP